VLSGSPSIITSKDDLLLLLLLLLRLLLLLLSSTCSFALLLLFPGVLSEPQRLILLPGLRASDTISGVCLYFDLVFLGFSFFTAEKAKARGRMKVKSDLCC